MRNMKKFSFSAHFLIGFSHVLLIRTRGAFLSQTQELWSATVMVVGNWVDWSKLGNPGQVTYVFIDYNSNSRYVSL